jgi:hypothetical protein
MGLRPTYIHENRVESAFYPVVGAGRQRPRQLWIG